MLLLLNELLQYHLERRIKASPEHVAALNSAPSRHFFYQTLPSLKQVGAPLA